jgi:hypothetical protein
VVNQRKNEGGVEGEKERGKERMEVRGGQKRGMFYEEKMEKKIYKNLKIVN